MSGLADMIDLSAIGLLAQVGPYRMSPWIYALESGSGLLALVYSVFWCWMMWHCMRTEPDRQYWVWLILMVPVVGVFAYFFTRFLPAADYRAPAFLRRWTRGRELSRLETAAVQIGNAHQFVQWGDALRDAGMLDEAANAYSKALAKDPQSLQALWGAAQVAATQNRHADVCQWTRQILDKDPQYKFGDVSLAYGKALLEQGDVAATTKHFEQHVHRWRHPEAVYVLATLHAQQGNTQVARDHLQALLHDINGSPAAIARRYGRWKSRARQLLRKL